MRLCLIAVLACFPMGAFAQASDYEGLYRPNTDWAQGWDCTTLGMDGGAIGIQGGQFVGVENTCDLSGEVPVDGMPAHAYDMTCMGEGESYTERLILMRGDGVLYVIRPGFVAEWLACGS